MNHHHLESTCPGSSSTVSDGDKELERSGREQLASSTNVELPLQRSDVFLSHGKDFGMAPPPPSPKPHESSAAETEKIYERRNSKRSSSYSAARDFAKQYCAAKRLSGTVTTVSSSFSVSSDELRDTNCPDFVSSKPRCQRPSNFEEGKEDSSATRRKLSISEMKQMVIENLPPEVIEQVPASAWQRIFSHDDIRAPDQSPLVRRLRGGSKNDVTDFVSAISDIVSRRSGGTTVFSDVSDLMRDDLTSPRTSCLPKTKAVVTSRRQTADDASLPAVKDDVPTFITTPSSQGQGLSSSAAATAGIYNMNKGKPRVRFHMVWIRNYGSILTLNPAVTTGPAIGLGWDYDPNKDEKMPVDDFERSKARSGPCRFSDDLLLGRETRESFLLSLGYSEKVIADTIRQTIRIKNMRKQTVQNLCMLPLEEILEKASRRVKRVLDFPCAVAAKARRAPNFPDNNDQFLLLLELPDLRSHLMTS
jgi:hypothetical protein